MDAALWDYEDAQNWADLVERAREQIPRDAVRRALGETGDAVAARVSACLEEADALLKLKAHGPALTLAVTAAELMIENMLLRPMVQGAFLSDQWAKALVDEIIRKRESNRGLLPAVLRVWDIDITSFAGPNGGQLWELLGTVFTKRHGFVHRYEPPGAELAVTAVESVRAFQRDVVGAVARALGFTLEATGKWSEIKLDPADPGTWETFTPRDPFQ